MAIRFMMMHHSYLNALRNLSDAEFGRLVRSLMRYSIDPEDRVQMPAKLETSYELMCDQIDRERDSYGSKAEASRANGTLGGRPKGSKKGEQGKPKKPTENLTSQVLLGKKPRITYGTNKEEEEGEEEGDIYTDDDDDIRVRVRGWVQTFFGREATEEEVQAIAQAGELNHAEPLLVEEIIAKAARMGARTPAAYIRKMLAEAGSEWIRTLSEYERCSYLRRVSEGDVEPMPMSEEEAFNLLTEERLERREKYALT